MSTSTTLANEINNLNNQLKNMIPLPVLQTFSEDQARFSSLSSSVSLSISSLLNSSFPSGVPLLTQDKKIIKISEIKKDRVAVVVFFRGSWCPYCNITLNFYQQQLIQKYKNNENNNKEEIAWIAVAPQQPEENGKMKEREGEGKLDFEILTDSGNKLASELGIVIQPSEAAYQVKLIYFLKYFFLSFYFLMLYIC